MLSNVSVMYFLNFVIFLQQAFLLSFRLFYFLFIISTLSYTRKSCHARNESTHANELG